ncbi:hypothetical protein GGR42_002875 [Saonia flava]|uniref:Uncharacterized protein n=1 Tax=Saonia flava TaxID=523696 RepID=A0A846R4T3_9FLAO|nr:hypothetical protein [Saonia flava]NJB72384.1 hypothetical protein [Saonia flava]
MKTILTLIFVLFIGVASQAQDGKLETKVETVTMTIVTATSYENVSITSENSVARVYKFKNSKVLKELSFTTKNNKVKLA